MILRFCFCKKECVKFEIIPFVILIHYNVVLLGLSWKFSCIYQGLPFFDNQFSNRTKCSPRFCFTLIYFLPPSKKKLFLVADHVHQEWWIHKSKYGLFIFNQNSYGYNQTFNNDQHVRAYEEIWKKTLILINVGSLLRLPQFMLIKP